MNDILSCSSVYKITADAAIYHVEARVPGSWSGSAFRDHPCGIIRGTIKITNHWHTSKSVSIAITSDAAGWSRRYCTDPCAHGDPHPRPVSGEAVGVWSDGRWASEEFRIALEPKIAAILTDARERILRYLNWRAVEEASEKIAQAERIAQRNRQALASAAAV